MHLRQLRFIYSGCGPFTKNKATIKRLKETKYSKYIDQNKLDKACFQHAIDRRIDSDKILRDKAFNIAKNPKIDGYRRGLALMVYKFFDKNAMVRTLSYAKYICRWCCSKQNYFKPRISWRITQNSY